MTPAERAELRRRMRVAFAWVVDPEVGPSAVTAGECDRCTHEPRLVQPCGPPPEDLAVTATQDWALGRHCAIELGPDAWCDGHEEEAQTALGALRALPDDADLLARIWWLATGEVRPDPRLVRRAQALMERTAAPDYPRGP